jgi:hypothetical protein
MIHYIKNKIGIVGILYTLILLVFIISQGPFLAADADLYFATGTRGAFTDEGLNTSQVRNLVNHNHFNLLDSDNFLKTPFFSLFLYPFFKLFGISMVGARMITVFFCVTLLLAFFLRKKTLFIGILFVTTTMMLFPVFQYSHLCLAEMYSSLLIVVAALFYAFYKTEKRYVPLILLFALLFLSVLFKVQFIYILAIPILVKIGVYLGNRSVLNRNQFIAACIILLCIVVGIVFVWYVPFKYEWGQIAEQQSGSFSLKRVTFDLIKENVELNFLSNRYILFTLFFIFSFFAAIYHLVKKDYSKEYVALIFVSFSWFIVELHKLGLNYLPMRYLISFYLSMGFFTSIVMGCYLSQTKLVPRLKALSFFLVLLVVNCYFYKQAVFSRTYTVQKMNDYFQKITHENDVVIGPWAPAFTWETKCLSYPIWTDFLKERDIITYYHPDFIVSEVDEEDSGFAYKVNNIELNLIAASISHATIANWNVTIYRVNK